MFGIHRVNRSLLLLVLAGALLVSLTPAARTLVVTDINPIGPGSQPVEITTGITAPVYPPRLEVGVASGVKNDAWTTVSLTLSYDSMVVVASPNYDSADPPMVTRIQNASGSSFDVRIDRADGLTTTISGIDVHYMVVEEGTYTSALNGVTMEAAKYTSTVTDGTGSWVGESQSYSNSYTTPVVLGQVMTYADTDWSAFWAMGSSRTSVPDASNLSMGKHVAEDSDTTRTDETVGYVVLEQGSGAVGDLIFAAAVGSDSIQGTANSPPYDYSISGFTSPTAAIVSSAAMDGNDGGWPILYGATPLNSTTLSLAIEEDTIGDTDQSHTTEQVAYVVWE